MVIFRKLSRRAKDPLERRLYLAHTLELQGKPDEAEIELRRLIALDPEPARARTPGKIVVETRTV